MNLLRGVYLAGPMSGMTGSGMKRWRTKAARMLEMADIRVLDPTRRIPFHAENLEDCGLNFNLAKRIFKQDLRDIARCEVLLVDGRDHPKAKAQGTAAEIMFSHMKHKTIIIWTNGDALNPFLTAMATEIHEDLEDAVEAAIAYSV